MAITVSDLIAKLTEFSLRSPENREVEVMLGSTNEVVWEFEKANDVVGEGQRYLVFVPSMTGKRLGIRVFEP